ncbi:MAG: lipid-transfer protein [Burkholderiaceae bacterium]|nr:lipid-transfer protein [Burkholderiaceae bacterium]
MTRIRDKAAVVGIGQTEFSASSGRGETRLALEAITAALADAGIKPSEVDGIVRYGVAQHGVSDAWVAHNLGVKDLRLAVSLDYGGSQAAAMVGQAAMAVATGAANVVVGYRSLNGSSGRRPGSSDTYVLYKDEDPNYDNFLMPAGFTAPIQMYAVAARRMMHEYGTTAAQLAEVAVVARDYASRNPKAQMFGRPLTREQCRDAEMIASPLRKFDCCIRTDGAVAFVVTSSERARHLRQPPVYVKAASQGSATDIQGPLYSYVGRPDLLDTSGFATARNIYDAAGMRPSDIDVAQLYDCFTVTLLMALEAYGFCEPGESGAFVEAGNLGLGGTIPTNTAGGHLSEGYLHGVNHVLEGVRQMRGSSTSQVDGAQTCLVTSGLPVPTSALILGKTQG